MSHRIPKPHRGPEFKGIVESTPARLGVWRAGTRPTTSCWLEFRQDHAMARDAVHSELSQAFLDEQALDNGYPIVQTQAADRRNFVLNPPLGKIVSDEVIDRLKKSCLKDRTVQIVVSDGLSAAAVETNVPELLPMLMDGFALESISVGTPVFVRFGRVAVADQIAHALGASITINLIGERPGLSSALGLSAYITYNPGPDTISSDRTVVSNIHEKGTPAPEAGAYIVQLTKQILEYKVSGVKLQELQ